MVSILYVKKVAMSGCAMKMAELTLETWTGIICIKGWTKYMKESWINYHLAFAVYFSKQHPAIHTDGEDQDEFCPDGNTQDTQSRPPYISFPWFKRPKQFKTFFVPTNYRFRFHNNKNTFPTWWSKPNLKAKQKKMFLFIFCWNTKVPSLYVRLFSY